MHWIQKHSLRQLILHKEQRFSQLKPRDVESNLFMYHLKQLMREGYVHKLPSGMYELSAKGQRFADELSLKSLERRAQPHIVILVAVSDQQGRWLLYRRKRQPLINQIGFPYGKLHLGESIQAAAERELREKTGLTARLQHRGDGYITMYESQETISEVFFHLFVGNQPQGQLRADHETGEALWGDLSGGQLMASMPDLISSIKKTPANRRFFVELEYRD